MQPIKILTDDVEPDPLLNFNAYGESIVNMIKGSYPKFSIGIYGEWGTGKTTMMTLIEKKIKMLSTENVIGWDEISDPGSENIRIITYLKNRLGLGWLEKSAIQKVNDRTIRITDNKFTRKQSMWGFTKGIPNHSLWINIDNMNNNAILTSEELDTETLTVKRQNQGTFLVKGENGKTNLYLNNNEILTVWFNAWRYEREEQFALIALMKTIAYTMGDLPVYKELKKVFLRGLEIIGKDVLRHFALEYVMTEKGVEEFEKNLMPKMELLSAVDRDTIYFEGMKKIEEEMKKIVSRHKIVIFIDDLDRCEAKKALEDFESTKIFLGIEGFIFIIGLSYETLSKLISLQYQTIGVKGEEYIRKIIQVSVNLPKWKEEHVSSLLDRISKTIGPEYTNLLNRKDLFASAANYNPREVKRLINRFVVTHHVDPGINPEEYLVRQALETRWSDFYKDLDNDDKYRELVKEYAHYDQTIRNARIKEKKDLPENPPDEWKKLFKIDSDLWTFLDKYKDIISTIVKDWSEHKESYESSADPVNKVTKSVAKKSNVVDIVDDYRKMIEDVATFSSSLEEFNSKMKAIRDRIQSDEAAGDLSSETVSQLDRIILKAQIKGLSHQKKICTALNRLL